jgi:hypothetical protein
VVFVRHPGHPLRLHGRWLQLVSRPRERETRGRR